MTRIIFHEKYPQGCNQCLPSPWFHFRLLWCFWLGRLCAGHCGGQYGLLRLLRVLQRQDGHAGDAGSTADARGAHCDGTATSLSRQAV